MLDAPFYRVAEVSDDVDPATVHDPPLDLRIIEDRAGGRDQVDGEEGHTQRRAAKQAPPQRLLALAQEEPRQHQGNEIEPERPFRRESETRSERRKPQPAAPLGLSLDRDAPQQREGPEHDPDAVRRDVARVIRVLPGEAEDRRGEQRLEYAISPDQHRQIHEEDGERAEDREERARPQAERIAANLLEQAVLRILPAEHMRNDARRRDDHHQPIGGTRVGVHPRQRNAALDGVLDAVDVDVFVPVLAVVDAPQSRHDEQEHGNQHRRQATNPDARGGDRPSTPLCRLQDLLLRAAASAVSRQDPCAAR